MIDEVWKVVPGYPGYDVSNLGRVRSRRPLRNGAPRPAIPRVMPALPNSDGYPAVALYNGTKGSKWDVTVARLVLLTFQPKGSESGLMALHWDGNKANNQLSNLYWGTAKNNSDDSHRHGTYVHGTEVNTCILTEEQVRYVIRQRRKRRARLLARELRCSIYNIYAIWSGKTWKHLQTS